VKWKLLEVVSGKDVWGISRSLMSLVTERLEQLGLLAEEEEQ
jgi:hypothetical protein